MRNKKIAYIGLLALGFLVTGIGLRFLNKPTASVESEGAITVKKTNEVLLFKYWTEFKSNDKRANNCALEENLNGNKDLLKLRNEIGTSSKLVFKFTEFDCDACIDAEIKNLEILAKQVGSDKIFLLASYSNPRDLYTFRIIKNLKIKVYNIGDRKLGLPIENENQPFLFIIDSTLMCRNVFIPFKEFPEFSDKYYASIKNKLLM